ncbi:Kinesin-like protein KIF21A [Geodia barretti]|uniref:Kinesin-like protein KIF21A n=1 Tax=Geodia barretti TaxID=519541 RepID=A0AA35XDL8_GEOBA|nr:Kinesin-like protein KIF21A [Geodia barretti]
MYKPAIFMISLPPLPAPCHILQESSEEDLTVQGSDSSDDSEEEIDDSASLASSVADLSSEINLKEQLVDQLEKAQTNLHVMRQQYEEKMSLLQTQIKNIESERDKVLKDIASKRSQSGGVSSKDVKARYEKQLGGLRGELKTLKMAKKEHSKALKKNAQNENELRRLKADLLEMKKARVKLLNQMRAEASRKKQEEARHTRHVSQLKKESTKKEHKIQSLEADAQRKAIIMKRRADELALLRRQTRMRHSASNSSLSSTSSSSSHPHPSHPLSSHSSASGGVGVSGEAESSETTSVVFRDRPSVKTLATKFERNSSHRKSSVFTSTSARKKWRNFEKKITDAIMNRLTVATLSKDMDRWIEKRDRLSRRADELRYHRSHLLKESSPDPEELQSIEEDLDSLLANVEYIQSNIVELQNELIAVDDSKSDSDTMEAHAIITQCAPRDAKYLLEHLMTMTLSLGVKAEQQSSLARSLEARLRTSEDNAELMKSFSSPQVSHPLMAASRTVTKSRSAGGRGVGVPVALDFRSENSSQGGPPNMERPSCTPQMAPHNMLCITTHKMRRRTFLPSEINIGPKKMTRPSSANDNCLREEAEEHQTDGEGSGAKSLSSNNGRRPLKKSSKMSMSVQDLTADSSSSSSSSSQTSLSTTPSSPNAPRQLGANGKPSVWSRLTRAGSTNLLNDNRGQLQAEKTRAVTRHSRVPTLPVATRPEFCVSLPQTTSSLAALKVETVKMLWDADQTGEGLTA